MIADKLAYTHTHMTIVCFLKCIIHLFISGKHHYKCVVPNVDITIQSQLL